MSRYDVGTICTVAGPRWTSARSNMETRTFSEERGKFEIQARTNRRHSVKCKAGVALLRRTRQRTEVLLVQHINGLWSLPKGKRKPGESTKEACLRECREETGYEPGVLRFIGWGLNTRKGFRFYLWKSEFHGAGALSNEPKISRSHEILRSAWVALSEAKQMLRPWQAILLARVSTRGAKENL